MAESGPLRNLQEFFAEYQPIGTVASITIQANGNVKKWRESEIEGKVVCKDISICDRDFPYRIDHLGGELEFTQSSLRAPQLVGQHGEVEVCINGFARGSGRDRQYRYQVTSRNLILDQALYAALTAEQKRLWDAFRPTGTVVADYRLTRTSPTDKRLSLTVNLQDVTAAYQDFPYPLTGLSGTLFFDLNSIVLSDVVSRTGGGQIRLNGKVTESGAQKPNYYISIDAQDVPLDAALRDALPARHRALFGRFDLRGLADIRARVFSPSDPNEAASASSVVAPDSKSVSPAGPAASRRVNFLADVSCRQGSLKLPLSNLSADRRPAAPDSSTSADRPQASEPGPLIVSEVTAEATITPDSLSIRKLEGRHDRSPVAITGGALFREGDDLKQCHIKIAAQQVPLTGATIGLLPPALAGQAAALRPEGDISLAVELDKADSNRPPEYTVVVNCLGDKINHEGFPYPLHDIRGTVSFGQDTLVLKNITAKPGDAQIADFGWRLADSGLRPTTDANPQAAIQNPPATIQIDGSAALGQGAWQGSFTLRATNLLFTENLGRALPKTLAGLYRELSPQGAFDLDLTKLKVSQAAADETIVAFGGQVSPKPCRWRISGAPMELAGALEAEGSYSTKLGFQSGHARLAAARLVVKGKEVTHAGLDAAYDPNAQKWTATNFTGNCYGGKLLGSLEVGPASPRAPAGPAETPDLSWSSGLEYQLQVALHNVDLQQFLTAGRRTDGNEPRMEETELLSSVLRSSSSTSSGVLDASLGLCARIGDARTEESRSGTSGERSPVRGGPVGRRGVCRIEIANMQVGKVSPLGNVLSVLRLSEPTDYEFERMGVDSYLRDDQLLIPKLDLSGRNAAFTGAGTMDLPTEDINLTLTGRGPRVAAAGPSVLQSLTEGLGGAVVRMEVTGKASSPRVQTKALPVIEDSLRLLGTPEEGKKGNK